MFSGEEPLLQILEKCACKPLAGSEGFGRTICSGEQSQAKECKCERISVRFIWRITVVVSFLEWPSELCNINYLLNSLKQKLETKLELLHCGHSYVSYTTGILSPSSLERRGKKGTSGGNTVPLLWGDSAIINNSTFVELHSQYIQTEVSPLLECYLFFTSTL